MSYQVTKWQSGGQFLKGTIVSLQQTELISLVFTIPQ